MTETINPKTGLRETPHPYYRIPHVQQRNINALRLNGQRAAVHTVPIGEGLTLDFYSSFSAGDELFVVFHGANSATTQFYPRFERVKSVREKAPSFLNFADPTMQVGINDGFQLAWYLGGPNFDPLNDIAKVIRRAVGRTGAKHLVFMGGSGGGFAALRASAMWPGSLAFIQDPQTNISVYIPRVVKKYFETMWPGWSQPALLQAFPERFNMVRHYAALQPSNFVYYAQNSSDTVHFANHYMPFLEAHGMKDNRGLNAAGNRFFALFDGENQGHGKITAAEFDHHFAEAMEFWRGSRKP